MVRLNGAASDVRMDRISDKPVWYSFNYWACFFGESILCNVNRHAVRGAESSALRTVYAWVPVFDSFFASKMVVHQASRVTDGI
ncbi:hypothetical protein J2782_000432 [Brucella pseudogrignonensis]|uniref:Uncharacterized protein n=1 Tax=Brucella pseudogrignonensis TaxID=419475 RepID=A0ABU1M3W2_9HYPH|nr:hypothetical protein [Brucella pseudogrignonensis]